MTSRSRLYRKTDRSSANRSALHILSLGALPAALLGTALMSLPVSAQVSGGTWLADTSITSSRCDAGAVGDDYVGQCDDTAGQANNANVVFDDSATTADNLIGGISTGAARQNTVTLSDGTINEFVYGGKSSNYDAAGNTVNVTGGTVVGVVGGQGHVYGGHTLGGNAIENEVILSGGTLRNVYGGYSQNGDATGNSVTVSGSTNTANVFGGRSNIGNATGNTVTVSGGNIGYLYGGSSISGPGVTNNTVIVSGGVINLRVYGGYGDGVDGNTVTISGGILSNRVYGGYSRATDVTNNTVTVSGGNVNNWVYGGESDTGSAIGNAVDISGGILTDEVFGGVSQDANVIGNSVVISNGDVGGPVFGGYSFDIGDANNNIVTISGGSIADYVNGGTSSDGDAIGNTVNISGGTINGEVVGGYAYTGNATGNIVNISGGDITQDVYGGRVNASVGGLSTHNRVILSGAPTFDAATVIGGGTNSADVTGNVLEVRSKGLTAGNVTNFEQYHFLLPAGIQADDVVLTLTDAAGTDVSGSKVGVVLQAGGQVLEPGDQVALLHNSAGVTSTGVVETDITAYKGISLEMEFDLARDANNLYAITQKVEVRDQTKAPVEGRVSAMAFSQQGADMIAGAAMNDMRTGADGAFGVISGGDSRYDTGSHVDVDGVTMLLGAKKRFQMGSGSLAAGAFVEGGWGNYDTYNDFDSGNVRGSGSADYYGVGVMLRHDWESGLYAEGSLRGGRISSDWSSKDMGVADASYDISTPYYGAHLGLGYVFELSERTSVDVSAKYLWSHQDSEDADIAGDPYHFDSVDSQRTRLGARVNYAFNDRFTGYAGAAWEHEYDGAARATVYGKGTPSPSLEGDTGVFELGVAITPSVKSPLTVTLGVQGYAGEREGAGGSLDVNWAF